MTFGLALVVRGLGGFDSGSPYFSARAAATLSRGAALRREAARGEDRLFGTSPAIRKVCFGQRSRDTSVYDSASRGGHTKEWAFKARQKRSGPGFGPIGEPVWHS